MHTTTHIIEFLLWLLIAASVIAVLTSRLKIPYTVALVVGGLLIDAFHLPIAESFSLTPEIVLILFLPALLFEAGLNINIKYLRENIKPIMLLAVVGVLLATFVTGYAVHWILGLPIFVALLFGALISATDPISVIAILKELGVSKRLAVILEGESLLNDGTAIVLFKILLLAVISGNISVADGVREFFVVSLGGTALGLLLGYGMSKITARIDDPRIEITLTTILAYGSYLIAEHLHISGVIATVVAGLMMGNYGATTGMSARTRVALWTFWEYMVFVINSLVFLLIGIEVHIVDLIGAWQSIAIVIGLVIFSRALAVYLLVPIANKMSKPIPWSWQHVLVWGGLHGTVSLALALTLERDVPYRNEILTLTFGVVTFSLLVQGMTTEPLLKWLKIMSKKESDYDTIKVRQMASTSAERELNALVESHVISPPVYEQLRQEVQATAAATQKELQQLYQENTDIASEELQLARLRLLAAEKSTVQRAMIDGIISLHTGENLLADIDDRLTAVEQGETVQR